MLCLCRLRVLDLGCTRLGRRGLRTRRVLRQPRTPSACRSARHPPPVARRWALVELADTFVLTFTAKVAAKVAELPKFAKVCERHILPHLAVLIERGGVARACSVEVHEGLVAHSAWY